MVAFEPMSTPNLAPHGDQKPRESLFGIGDLVTLRSNPTIVLPIIEVVPGEHEFRYRVFQNHAKSIYYESQLQAAPQASDALARLSSNELQVALTSHHILSSSSANLFSLHSGRVRFVPYQYRPVLRLIRSDRPRLLIADEVGVGKTIEAGFIIKELRARVDLSSVLIICPKALVAERKWFLEMKRFDEQFTALDGKSLRHCLRETHLEGHWPDQYSNAILPFSLFDSDLVYGAPGNGSKRPGLLNLDPPPKFDLVIVDEAHHIRNSDTFLHQGVRFFCDNAEAVIFLSATPVQLGHGDLYTLLNVLRPDLIIDESSFSQMAAPNAHINAAIHACRALQENWRMDALAALERASETEWGAIFLHGAPAFESVCESLRREILSDHDRLAVVRTLEELYTFSGLINRTRRRDIGEFTTRKPETVTVPFTADQQLLHDSLLEIIARIFSFCHGQQNVKFMMTTIRRQAASCLYGLAPLLHEILNGKLDRLELLEANDSDEEIDLDFIETVRSDIAALLERVQTLDTHDPKADAFLHIVVEKAKLPTNKTLVFSTFRHTLAYLAQKLQTSGLRFGVVHGSVGDEERSELRSRFALPKEESEAIDVLLSSEVGCEGLDFQFCDFLVNYDLPWNPMRIEQRIGRIDRYGQKSETVAVINFLTPGTVDADIYERCLWRIGVFQHAIGGNEEILGAISREIHHIADSFTLTPQEREQRLRQLSDNGIRQIQEEQELEKKQSELFGLNIPNQSWREEIEAARSRWISPSAIQRCVSTYLLARLGTGSDYLSTEKTVRSLRISHDARTTLLDDFKRLPKISDVVSREWEKWLTGDQPSLSVTFEQQAAIDSPKAVYLWAMHPLVRQAAYYFRFDEPVYVSLSTKSTTLPAGKHRFAIYHWSKQGVKPDETLVPIASEPLLEPALLDLFLESVDGVETAQPSQDDFDRLDARHHELWRASQTNHLAENRQRVEHRVQSLKVSHRARCEAIGDHIKRAGNDRIALMKQSELARANADFNRRMADLQRQATSADIHASPLVFGEITVQASLP